MNERNESLCEKLMEYAAGEGTETERGQFEKHMENCAACAEEAAAYREVWNRLAEEGIEPVEPPADLKAAVLQVAFAADDGSLADGADNLHAVQAAQAANEATRLQAGPSGGGAAGATGENGAREARLANAANRRITLAGRPGNRRRIVYGCGAAALLALVFAGGWFARGMADPGPDARAMPPFAAESRIETLYPLTAVRENGLFAEGVRAYGVACLVRSGDSERLVVYVFGSPRTEGDERYQVWLQRDGERSSAGTFTVDVAGIGILTLPFDSGASPFDAVGVTLEPGAGSEFPRGPQMFGSGEIVRSTDA